MYQKCRANIISKDQEKKKKKKKITSTNYEFHVSINRCDSFSTFDMCLI